MGGYTKTTHCVLIHQYLPFEKVPAHSVFSKCLICAQFVYETFRLLLLPLRMLFVNHPRRALIHLPASLTHSLTTHYSPRPDPLKLKATSKCRLSC